jgi:hypothetical protein
MSQLSLKKIKLGDNADLSKNFVISVPAVADGTLTIGRENGADVLSIAADGKADFSFGLFGFEYGASGVARRGYIKVPVWLGGWVLQWGSITFTASAATNVGYLKPFTDLSSIVGVASQNNGVAVGNYAVSTDFGVSLTLISAWIPSAQTVGYNFIAVGK